MFVVVLDVGIMKLGNFLKIYGFDWQAFGKQEEQIEKKCT